MGTSVATSTWFGTAQPCPAKASRSPLLLRHHVDDFAFFRHAEVFAGDALDGVGGFLDAFDLGTEASVVGFQAFDVAAEIGHADARLLQLDDAAVAEEEGNQEDEQAGEANCRTETGAVRARADCVRFSN